MGSRVMGGAGQVQVRFHLRSDGRIENLVVVRSSVDELMTYYCRRAIEAPAPFEVWPPEMLREIGSTSREITFTFHYLQ
jgi:TonB family protein